MVLLRQRIHRRRHLEFVRKERTERIVCLACKARNGAFSPNERVHVLRIVDVILCKYASRNYKHQEKSRSHHDGES
jgi:hypothetical protein